MREKRQLHLEGVFTDVRGRMLAHDRRVGEQRVRARVVYRSDPERRLESLAEIDRHAVEPDEVRRPDEDGDVERPAAQQTIRMRGDRPRVHQAGVRRDQRRQIAGHLRRAAIRALEMPIDGSRERRRRAGIPRACNGRLADPCHG